MNLRLYNFKRWDRKNRAIQLSEWDTDEIIFKNELLKIKKDQTIIDVGSEYGYYAIRAGSLVGSNGKVLAIEPHPETFILLKMNIKLHKVSENVIPIRIAISKESGIVELHETFSPGSTSIINLNVRALNKSRFTMWLEFVKNGVIFEVIRKKLFPVKYIVQIETLDKIAAEYGLGKIDLIKIDVEGAELDVLKGSIAILEKHKPILLVEVHFGCSWKPETLYKFLQKFGYSLTIKQRRDKALVIAHPTV